MPSYDYSHEHKVYIKQCSCCKTIVFGTDQHDENVKIFQEFFSYSGPSAGMADSMQSRCYACNSAKRRELGITREILEAMWTKQGGKCAICATDILIKRNAPPILQAHVDHNDDTGIVRELLCGQCNRGIGLFKHNSQTLINASNYLYKHAPVVPFKRRA